MRRPLVQFKNVTAGVDGTKMLRAVSFVLFEGEFIVMAGSDGSGKINISTLLSGEKCRMTQGSILLDGQPFAPQHVREAQRAGVFCTTNRTCLLDEMTIYENLQLNNARAHSFALINERLMIHEAQSMLDRFGLGLDARAPVHSLTPSEKCMVELVKFSALGARLVVMTIVSAVGTAEDDAQLLRVIRQLTHEGVTVLVLTNQYLDIIAHSDGLYLLTTQGRIAHMYAGEKMDIGAVRAFLSGGGFARTRMVAGRRKGAPVLEIENLCTGKHRGICFALYPGQVLGLYCNDGRREDSLPMAIAGGARYTGQICMDGRPVHIRSERDAFAMGIALIPSSPRQLYFPDLTDEENIEQPFLPRMQSRIGVLRSGLQRALKRDALEEMGLLLDEFGRSGYNDCIFPVVTRFMLYPFRVMILLHPSAVNDAAKTEMLYQLVERAAARGTALIVASTRLNELEAICSDIYRFD